MIFSKDICQRNLALVVMRFLAALCITQSHVACLLPERWQVAVVGADIGDGLFFFCAGYSLYLGRTYGGFIQWYGHKAARILPPFLVMGLLTGLFFGIKSSFIDVVSCSGYWFVKAIMIYYAVLYFVKRYCQSHLQIVFGVVCVALVAYGLLSFPFGPYYQLWGKFRFFSVFFLPVMTLGVVVGHRDVARAAAKPWSIGVSLMVMVVSLAVHFGMKIAIARGIVTQWTEFQLLTMFALMLAIYAIYELFTNEALKKVVLRMRYPYAVVYFVASLTLEIYVVNGFVIDRTPGVFPLNLVLAYLLMVCAAYVLKVATNATRQFISGKGIVLREMLRVD